MNSLKSVVIDKDLRLMCEHQVFSSVTSINALKTFMEWHVFAVWDFMSLAKRLQLDLTSVSLPWLPPQNYQITRLINEIILGEECDILSQHKYMSHFDMYRLAMQEIGANTSQINEFIQIMHDGKSWQQALILVGAPQVIREFVVSTLELCLNGTTAEVLGSFFYGREDSVPKMFQWFIDHSQIDGNKSPLFKYYLDRHIELDGEEHGPATQKMIENIVSNDPKAYIDLVDAANKAITMRIKLWDGILHAINNKH